MRIDRRSLCRVAAITAVFYLIGFACSADRPWLLYNHTPSVPIGFYILRSGVRAKRIRRGDLVAFALPRSAYTYARRRGDSTRVRLLKPVLAVAGDRVSTLHRELRINGALVCSIPDTDSAGRALPRWRHARTLKTGELFVGSTRIAHSFGSRFFGPIHTTEVIGVYRPLWLLPSLDDPKALLNDTPASTAIAPNEARMRATEDQSLHVKRAPRRLNEESLRSVRGAIPMRIDRRPLRRVAAVTAAQHLIGFVDSTGRPWWLYNHTPGVPIACYLLRHGAPTSRIELDDLVAFVLHGELRTAALASRPQAAVQRAAHWLDAHYAQRRQPVLRPDPHRPDDRCGPVAVAVLCAANAQLNNTPTSPAAASIGVCRSGTAAVTRN